MNKVVARFADGRVVKGTTADFFPNKETFHVSELDALADAGSVEIWTEDLKALFFVKDFAGDPDHDEANAFDPTHPAVGRVIRVVFRDGEELLGTTTGYKPDRVGFFLEPADRESNIERCYVVSAAAKMVAFQ